MKKIENLKKQLDFDLAYLNRSMEVLAYSLQKARKIGIKKAYVIEELDVYEALTSRFARTADILTQKIIKNLFMIMQEDAKTFIDRCNLSEVRAPHATQENMIQYSINRHKRGSLCRLF